MVLLAVCGCDNMRRLFFYKCSVGLDARLGFEFVRWSTNYICLLDHFHVSLLELGGTLLAATAVLTVGGHASCLGDLHEVIVLLDDVVATVRILVRLLLFLLG